MRALAATFAFMILLVTAAHGACLPSDITGITTTGAALPSYNPFTGALTKSVTVQVTATHPCTVDLAVSSPVVPPQMTGLELLAYDVRTQSGTSLVFSGLPSATAPIVVGAGNVGNTTIQVVVPAGQIVSEGAYADTNLVAQIFDTSSGTQAFLKAAALPVTGTVAKACQFASTVATNMNFTSAIRNGVPDPSAQQTTTFTGLSCTAPATIRLSGTALQPTQVVAPVVGLDAAIDFRASAVLGGASVILDTRGGADASSALRSSAGGATRNAAVGVTVNLVPGQPLMAGSYTSVLTVAIDPNP